MPDGICECGCGGKTTLIYVADKTRGYVVGEYYRYLRGHATRKYFEGKEREQMDRISRNNKRYQERNPEKRQAHIILNNALKLGKIERGPCEVCGEKAEAHHEDYSKPLEVHWLCRFHHRELHRARKAAA